MLTELPHAPPRWRQNMHRLQVHLPFTIVDMGGKNKETGSGSNMLLISPDPRAAGPEMRAAVQSAFAIAAKSVMTSTGAPLLRFCSFAFPPDKEY